MDLGHSGGDLAAPSAKPETSKVVFPPVTLDDKAAAAFTAENDIEPGKEYTGTVTFKVAPGEPADNLGASISLNITNITDVVPSGGAGLGDDAHGIAGGASEAGDDDGSEKILGVKLPPKKPSFREPVKASSNFLD